MEEEKYDTEVGCKEVIDPFEDYEHEETAKEKELREFAESIEEDFRRYGEIHTRKGAGDRDIWLIQTKENFLEMRVLQTKEILLKAKTAKDLYEKDENPFAGYHIDFAGIDAPIDNNKLMLIPYLSMMGILTTIEPMPQRPRSHHKKK